MARPGGVKLDFAATLAVRELLLVVSGRRAVGGNAVNLLRL